MNTEELLSLIREIEGLKGGLKARKFVPGDNERIKSARRKMYELMGDEEYVGVAGYVLVKQHHAHSDTVAIYTKDSWERHEEARRSLNLNWIT